MGLSGSGFVFLNRGPEFEMIFFDFGMEGGSRKAQEFGRLRTIAARQIERFANDYFGDPVHT